MLRPCVAPRLTCMSPARHRSVEPQVLVPARRKPGKRARFHSSRRCRCRTSVSWSRRSGSTQPRRRTCTLLPSMTVWRRQGWQGPHMQHTRAASQSSCARGSGTTVARVVHHRWLLACAEGAARNPMHRSFRTCRLPCCMSWWRPHFARSTQLRTRTCTITTTPRAHACSVPERFTAVASATTGAIWRHRRCNATHVHNCGSVAQSTDP